MTDALRNATSVVLPDALCLRMVAGPSLGKTWNLVTPITTIGRTIPCHVRIDDAHVSRVQCELEIDNNRVRMRNVGQRNPTLVNGVPREEVMLSPGDMISFAGVSLVLDRAGVPTSTVVVHQTDSRTTQPFANAVHLQSQFDLPRYARDTALAGDLHRLLGLVRMLAKADSLDALATHLKSNLNERLKAERTWIAWRLDNQCDMALYPPASAEETGNAPFGTMLDACATAEGIAVPAQGKNDHVIAAPLIHGGQCIGAIAANRPEPRQSFAVSDLEYLVAAAECCAPIIRAAERLEQMQRDAQEKISSPVDTTDTLANSSAMSALQAEIRLAAIARVSVIFQGETGVGKELAARMLHDLSARCSGPYVIVNCAAISPELFESEVFGHERGAFTGAVKRRKGLFELAHGGTLFLDEITELNLANQAHLLRAVETGTFRPVGAEQELKVDVRVVSATNRSIPDKEQLYLRRDLYHRLAGIVVRIKPLREHKEDIVNLARHFLKLVAPHAPKHPKEFTLEAIEKLTAYDWPGNIRELRNVVERACYTAPAEFISSHDIHIEDAELLPGIPERTVSFDALERQHLIGLLQRHGNSVIEVARLMGLSRSAVYYKLRRHGIKPKSLRG